MIISEDSKLRVVWQGSPEEFTHTNKREIYDYFSQKYGTQHVKIDKEDINIKQMTSNVDVSDINADASELVLNDEYQRRLIAQYIKDNNIDVNLEHIYRLDNKVNSLIVDYKEKTVRHRNIKPLDIEFSNFLSYGENNKIDFTKNVGITTIIGKPENFSGKTTLAVDLLLFLFFGDTTKTSVNANVFNLYSLKDSLYVRGRVKVDNDIIVIKRTLTRVKKKDGTYNVTGNLELFNEDANGNLVSDNKENSGGTEKYIKEVVGTYDDFLITILTTGKNLTNLIETKPTERGKLLTRFIGLDIFNEKLLKAKDDYKLWYSGTKLSKYTTSELLSSNKKLQDDNDALTISLDENKEQEELLETKIKQFEDDYELLVNSKKLIEESLYRLDKNSVINEIESINSKIEIINVKNKGLLRDIVKPEQEKIMNDEMLVTFNNEIKSIKKKIDVESSEKLNTASEIRILKNALTAMDTAKLCPHCNKALDYDNIEEEKTNVKLDIETKEKALKTILSKIGDLELEVSQVETKIKDRQKYIDDVNSMWDLYFKTDLLIEKNKIEMDQLTTKLDKNKDILDKLNKLDGDIKHNQKIDTQINIVKYNKNISEGEKKNLVLAISNILLTIKSNTNTIETNVKLLETLKKEDVANKVYTVYLDIFGKNGISKMVLATMIPVINQHLDMLMFDASEFTLELRLNSKEEVDFVMVDNYTGKEKDLKSGSGYESTIASLALRAVLSKVCSLPKLSINVYDEITGGVAQANMDNIRMFFERIKTFFEHIIIISHDDLVQSWGENKIYVEKINNVSYVKDSQ